MTLEERVETLEKEVKYLKLFAEGKWNKPGRLKYKKIIDPKDVLKIVSTVTGITQEEMKGKQRGREIVTARQLAIYLMRTELGWTTIKSAGSVNRDHSTAVHSVTKIEDEIHYAHKTRTDDLGLIAATDTCRYMLRML